MIRDFKIGNHRVTESFHFHIGAVIGTDGDGGVNDIGDIQHNGVDTLGILLLQSFQLGKAVGVCLDLRLDLFGLLQLGGVLFGLTHQNSDLLGEGISAGADLAGLGDGSAVFGVKLDDLVHQGKLLILKFLFDVFLYQFRVFSYKTYIMHVLFSSFFICQGRAEDQ